MDIEKEKRAANQVKKERVKGIQYGFPDSFFTVCLSWISCIMCFPYGKQQRSDLQVSPCDMLYSRCRSNDICVMQRLFRKTIRLYEIIFSIDDIIFIKL